MGCGASSQASNVQPGAVTPSESPVAAAPPEGKAKHKVCLVGSGNWGSAVARICGQNAAENPLFETEVVHCTD